MDRFKTSSYLSQFQFHFGEFQLEKKHYASAALCLVESVVTFATECCDLVPDDKDTPNDVKNKRYMAKGVIKSIINDGEYKKAYNKWQNFFVQHISQLQDKSAHRDFNKELKEDINVAGNSYKAEASKMLQDFQKKFDLLNEVRKDSAHLNQFTKRTANSNKQLPKREGKELGLNDRKAIIEDSFKWFATYITLGYRK